MTLTFAEAYERLLARSPAPGSTWSLEPTRQLLQHLGNPHRHFPSIHVGGTNGKGSVCALLDAALSAGGLRVGRYSSPHLVDFRERILVAGRPISAEAFVAWSVALEPVAVRTGASFFEVTTAMALADFAARGVDVAVVEVGLGGRLDSTNVLEPVASGVTKIALDHADYLGASLEAIAREKAGIAKADTPFIIGEPDPGLLRILSEEARRSRARVSVVPADRLWTGPLALPGVHQARNAAVAAALLDVLPPELRVSGQAVRSAFAATTIPGRVDRRGKWIFDVAHNPDGVDALVRALRESGPPRPMHALVGILGDKDWRAMLATLAPAVDQIWLTDPPSAPADRRWDLETVAPAARAIAAARVAVDRDFASALQQVQRGAATVLVTGSFHTVGDAFRRLPGFAPLG